MFNVIEKKIKLGEHTLTLETGRIARQATGSVVAKMGNTVVLCTVVANNKPKEGVDFFPLTVNYLERFYASGKIPGGFFKRETRPSTRETLISRLIDRPTRPLFPEGFFNEVQVICTTISYDPNFQPDIVATAGASAALAISGIPFQGPIAASRVGYKDGEYILNPDAEFCKNESMLDLVVAGTNDAVLMVESEAKELTEEQMLGAVMFGHKAFQPIIKAIKEMAKEAGKASWELNLPDNTDLVKSIKKIAEKKLKKAFSIASKAERRNLIAEAEEEVKKALVDEAGSDAIQVKLEFKKLEADIVRTQIIDSKKRIDGRGESDIRPILAEVDVLPGVVHGSALFTRGETQALVVTTLGTTLDEQMIDDLEGNRSERFMLDYNFPPYSVGEVGALRAPGRREIGHGKLAWRAICPLFPSKEEFPYSVRVVSEITESNGSSSMATVCGTSLALMSSGVPLPRPVAGIAMGLIKEGKKFVVLSDIMGDEDHLGDMDFKVAGTKNGITALQMDIKITGITEEIMEKALFQAKDGRLHILSKMAEAIEESRTELASSAPRIVTIMINKDKIGELIGPGGKVIKEITEKSGAKIDIKDDGTVSVASNDGEALEKALQMINSIMVVPEIGQVYEGKVSRILDFGVVVSLSRSVDGMVHVSEMAEERVGKPSDLVSEGDVVKVKVIDIEKNGRIKFTMKGLNELVAKPASEDSADDSRAKRNSGREDRRDDRREGRRDNRRDDRRDNRDGRDEKRAGQDEERNDSRRDDRKPAKRDDRRDTKRDDRRDDRSSREESSQPKKKRFF